MTEMTDLQLARADWLDAETRLLALQKENSDLRCRCFELESKLIAAQTMEAVWKCSFEGFAIGMLRP